MRFLITMLTVGLTAATLSAQNWPSFRGSNASGVSTTAGAPPISWDLKSSRNVAWTAAIPGLGHSSPIVWGSRVYVTTAGSASGQPRVLTGDSSKAGIDSAADTVSHTWRLIALDRASGKVVWDRVAHQGLPRVKRHVKASHASATPATDGRFIVALMGSEGLFCFDMNGALQWRADLGAMDVGLVDDRSYQWGPASSPVIYNGMVLVQNDRHADSSLAAFDLRTGTLRWQATHDEYPSWSTPVIYQGPGGPQVVTNSGKFIRGFHPATGKELWRVSDNNTQVKVPTPVVAGDLVIVTGGYPPGGRPIYAIRPRGTGDLDDRAFAWRTERGAPYTGTPLVYDGILYVCTDNGILSAYDALSGARIYQERVSPSAGGFSASLVGAGGRLFLAGEDGELFVIRAGRTFDLLAANAMGEILMATPAVSDDLLVVRTQTRLVALRSSSPDANDGGSSFTVANPDTRNSSLWFPAPARRD